ncbi:helix-turn-helix domain-containing protein [Flavihumibacter sp. ZG627]|uniref:helix-turn-helix domain-containing protein n=1 Tax=Flavihumibacter sp. ZG627 TaxID=1463156 RepID=UPI000693AD5E|nr:helix-turn-helix domain-containing protein [Flavihumibacter sp. ZG627]
MNNQTPTIRTEQCIIHPALRSLIRNIVIIEADFGDSPVSIEGNYMPSPDQAMFINLYTRLKSKRSGENNFNTVTSCTLIGAQITPFKLLVEESHKTVSIIFQPGGLNRFLNIPMTEIFDNGYSAREVVGREIEELLDKSHDTISLNELDSIIQSYFLRKLSRVKEALPIDFALQHLLANYNTNMDKIAGMACMSIRSFERKCKERLGMPAKMYARIARFHNAYKILESSPIISWTDLTYGLGYYDQTHFIKDFKEFARVTPTILQRELSDEHLQFQLDWDSI